MKNAMDYYILGLVAIFILFIGGMIYHIEIKDDFHLSKVLNYIFLIILVCELVMMAVFISYGISLCTFTKKLFCR